MAGHLSSSFGGGRDLTTFPLPAGVKTKLIKAGFRTSSDFQGLTPIELAKEAGLKHEEALETLKLISNISNSSTSTSTNNPSLCTNGSNGSNPSHQTTNAMPTAQTAFDLLKREASQKPIVTFCEEIDNMLGGGIPMGKMTEFCGVPGIGKTQFGMQLAVDVHLPKELEGVDGHCIYIDTEGSFMVDRVVEMAEAFVAHTTALAASSSASSTSLPTVESILSNIHYFRVHDYVEQIAIIHLLPTLLQQHPKVKLIIIDSITFHFRLQFSDMSVRTRLLHTMAQSLMSVAENHHLAVVLINQVTTKVEEDVSMLVPALGETWGHACTNRVILHWRDGNRWAFLYKSPSQKPASVPYQITAAGIRSI